jgi:hypothetical protein
MTADRFGIANVAPISKIICASKMERWDWLFSFQLSNFVFPSMFAKFGKFQVWKHELFCVVGHYSVSPRQVAEGFYTIG